jgi:hypothetical protein
MCGCQREGEIAKTGKVRLGQDNGPSGAKIFDVQLDKKREDCKISKERLWSKNRPIISD